MFQQWVLEHKKTLKILVLNQNLCGGVPTCSNSTVGTKFFLYFTASLFNCSNLFFIDLIRIYKIDESIILYNVYR